MKTLTDYKSYLPLIIIGVLAVALLFGADTVLVFKLQPSMGNTNASMKPNMNITLFEGELADGRFGFGYTLENLTSPGPTLRFTTADTINITVINIGTKSHAFAITTTPTEGANVLFNAAIGSADNPLQPGQEGSVVFSPDNAGFSYFYASIVPGDVEAGMYGTVVITTISPS